MKNGENRMLKNQSTNTRMDSEENEAKKKTKMVCVCGKTHLFHCR